MKTTSKTPTLEQFANSFRGGFWYSAGDDKKRSKKKGDEYDWKNNILFDHIEKLNSEGWGTYFTVNRFKASSQGLQQRTKKDCISIRAVFVEDDTTGKLVTKWNIPPSIIVESSPNKFHYYWLTRTKNFDEYERVMQTMVDEHNCDPKARDISRVLRIPGTLHNKGKPFEVRIVGGNLKRYEWNVITIAFPPAKIKKSSYSKDDKGEYDFATALQALTTTEDLHGSMCSIAASWSQKNIDKATFISMMNVAHSAIDFSGIDDKRQNEVADRFTETHLDECYDSAVAKFESDKELTTVIECPTTGDIYTRHDYPIGFTGKLAKEIWETMEYPNKEIAIVAAVFVCAVLSGRKDSFHKSGIKLELIVLAVTAVGKDTIRRALEKLIAQVAELNNPKLKGGRINCFYPSFGSYGVKVLVEKFNLSPSLGIIMSENGVKSSSSAGDQSSVKSFLMQNLVQEAYSYLNFSGINGIKQRPHGVNFTRIAESTKETYSSLFTSDSHGGGSTGRRLVSYVDHRPDDIPKDFPLTREQFSDEIVDGIEKLIVEALKNEVYDEKEQCYNMSAPINFKHRRQFIGDKFVNKIFVEMRVEENQRRKEVSDDDAGNMEWAQKSRRRQQISQLAFALSRTDAVVSDGDLLVTNKHWKCAENFVTETHRAEGANSDDYLGETESIAKELQRFFLSNLKNPKKSKRFGKFHDSKLIKEMIFDKGYISASACKAWKMCKSSSENNFKDEDDYLNKALEFGQSNGWWERNYKVDGRSSIKEYHCCPVNFHSNAI